MTKSDLSEIVLRYRRQGWTGYALVRRIEKHARLLATLDPEASAALHVYTSNQFGTTTTRRSA